MCATGHRVNSILTHLQQVREDLYSLAEDIYINADPHVSEEVKRTSEFLVAYNEKIEEFSRVATDVEALVRRHTAPAEETTTETIQERTPRERRERIVLAMDNRQPHSLDEDFTYKRPYGFSLGDSVYREVNTWRNVLDRVCRNLSAADNRVFLKLPDNPLLISIQGKHYFSRNPSDHHIPMDVGSGIHVETVLSAKRVSVVIIKLLEAFGIPKEDCIVFLREDRNAEATAAA